MSEETPFADKVLDSHLFSEPRYPSPYIQVLGEALPELEGSAALKRKDENVKTEETILKPEIIPLSFSPITNRLMHIIFEYYVDKMKRAAVTTLQGGGRHGVKRGGKKTRRRDKKRRNKRYSRK
jgi:hypothetical protein